MSNCDENIHIFVVSDLFTIFINQKTLQDFLDILNRYLSEFLKISFEEMFPWILEVVCGSINTE